MAVLGEMFVVTIGTANATSAWCDPQTGIFTVCDPYDKIIADTVWIKGIIFVYCNRIPTLFIPSIPGNKLHKAAAILHYAKYIVVRKTTGYFILNSVLVRILDEE